MIYSQNSYLGKTPYQTTSNTNFGGGFLSIMPKPIAIGMMFCLSSNEKMVSQNVGWDANVRVLASNGQNILGASDSSSYYGKFLLENINKDSVETIEDANKSLMKTGYRLNIKKSPFSSFINRFFINQKTLFPLETPRTMLGIFDKKEQNKHRYVLILTQKGEERHDIVGEDFAEKLKETYKINDENIVKIIGDSTQDIEKGIDSIRKKLDKNGKAKNAELLIFYNGHGFAKAADEAAKKAEGDMEGLIFSKLAPNTKDSVTGVSETEIKKIFHQKLKRIKTIFIINSCKAGAWIAETTPKPTSYFA